MKDELKKEIEWCEAVAVRARELLSTLPTKVVIERAREWCEGCYLIDTYSQRAQAAEGIELAHLTIRLGIIAGTLNYQVHELTVQGKQRSHRNKNLAHQATRVETAKRFEELREKHGRAEALNKLTRDLEISSRQLENRLRCKLTDEQRQQLDQLQNEPWFPEFLEHMDRVLPELLWKKLR